LLRFNSDEKQILDFSSQVPLKVVGPYGGGWALRRSAYRNRNNLQYSGSSYVSDTALFVYVLNPIVNDCLCTVIQVSSIMLKMPPLFFILK